MTAPAYPSTLPRPQCRGYAIAVESPVSESPSERGVGRARRNAARPAETVTLMFVFTSAQLATWGAFWRDTIYRGSIPFSIQLPNGYADLAQDVQAKATYKADDLGGMWRVSLPVELLNPPRMASSDIPFLVDYGLFDALHILIHEEIPGYMP